MVEQITSERIHVMCGTFADVTLASLVGSRRMREWPSRASPWKTNTCEDKHEIGFIHESRVRSISIHSNTRGFKYKVQMWIAQGGFDRFSSFLFLTRGK
jgi:hypothetical protein